MVSKEQINEPHPSICPHVFLDVSSVNIHLAHQDPFDQNIAAVRRNILEDTGKNTIKLADESIIMPPTNLDLIAISRGGNISDENYVLLGGTPVYTVTVVTQVSSRCINIDGKVQSEFHAKVEEARKDAHDRHAALGACATCPVAHVEDPEEAHEIMGAFRGSIYY